MFSDADAFWNEEGKNVENVEVFNFYEKIENEVFLSRERSYERKTCKALKKFSKILVKSILDEFCVKFIRFQMLVCGISKILPFNFASKLLDYFVIFS